MSEPGASWIGKANSLFLRSHHAQWLCLSDARQVFDLPKSAVKIVFWSMTAKSKGSQTLEGKWNAYGKS
jgi:hypothetical protein